MQERRLGVARRRAVVALVCAALLVCIPALAGAQPAGSHVRAKALAALRIGVKHLDPQAIDIRPFGCNRLPISRYTLQCKARVALTIQSGWTGTFHYLDVALIRSPGTFRVFSCITWSGDRCTAKAFRLDMRVTVR